MLKIFNKSSTLIKEIPTKTIDLAVMDPPYNVGSVFGKQVDSQNPEKYRGFLSHVMKEQMRVLKPQGRILVHAPERTYRKRVGCLFSEMIVSLAEKAGLFLETFHPFWVKEKAYCFPIENWENVKWRLKTVTRRFIFLREKPVDGDRVGLLVWAPWRRERGVHKYGAVDTDSPGVKTRGHEQAGDNASRGYPLGYPSKDRGPFGIAWLSDLTDPAPSPSWAPILKSSGCWLDMIYHINIAVI